MDVANVSQLENEILIYRRWLEAAEEQGLPGAMSRLSEEITLRQNAIARLQQTRVKALN